MPPPHSTYHMRMGISDTLRGEGHLSHPWEFIFSTDVTWHSLLLPEMNTYAFYSLLIKTIVSS